MEKTKVIENVSFDLCSVPDSEGLVLEILDENQFAFAEVRINKDGIQWLRFFSSDTHMALSISDVERAIEIAKEQVVNVKWDEE